jgi:peroxiredoxin
MLPLGTQLPAFSLPDTVTGSRVDSAGFAGSVALVAFLCNHCPYVIHIQRGFSAFAKEAVAKGVRVVAISPNDVTTHPEDGPSKMAEEARNAGYAFPYLFDESQAVAKAFRAACTPEFYLFDRDGRLAYRGRFDRSSPRNGAPVTGDDLRAAVDALMAGRQPSPDQEVSIGCSIKWKAGNEPDY